MLGAKQPIANRIQSPTKTPLLWKPCWDIFTLETVADVQNFYNGLISTWIAFSSEGFITLATL